MNYKLRNPDSEQVGFFFAVGLLLVPIWLPPGIDTQDGPVHLYNAELILQLLADSNAWFSNWVTVNHRPDPTWVPHLFMSGLLSILPQGAAERLFQSACVGLLPLSARYALGGLGAESGKWSWLSLPMAYSFPFHMGFYNFCIGLSFAMFMLGYWLRQEGSWGVHNIIVQAILALAAYFSHVFALLAFGIAMAPVAVVRLLQSWRTTGVAATAKSQVIPWIVAFAPALILAAEFLTARSQEAYPVDLVWRLKGLVRFIALQSYTGLEQYWSTSVSLILFILSVVALAGALRRRHVLSAAWVGSMGLLFAVAIFMPEFRMVSANGMKGGAYLMPRIGMVFYLSALFLIAAQPGWPQFRKSVIYLAVALTIIGFGIRWPVYIELEQQLMEYDSAERYVEPGDVVVALNVEHWSFMPEEIEKASIVADPTKHRVNWIAARRGAFSVNNYEANMGYFPLLFVPEHNPQDHLGAIEYAPPEIDLRRFERALGQPVDVILVWMAASRLNDGSSLISQIEGTGFRRVHVSKPGGRMWVYRRPAAIP